MARTTEDVLADIRLSQVGLAHASGARAMGYREHIRGLKAEYKDLVAVGQYWRVRIGGGKTMLGKVRSISNKRIGCITLERVDSEGDIIGKSDELNVILAAKADLSSLMEMDGYYGMVVPFGNAKRHICNHNLHRKE